ncbi:DUF6624 domain-containing protein [Streptomyces sp. NPDC048208]|uniref:DUF6624 domain-containing protein n=1 Tax=Streptomyces sp. NPDC048208 TaxID=3365515 RepID=UPI00371B674A
MTIDASHPALARDLIHRAERAAEHWDRRAREELDDVRLGRGRHDDYANAKFLRRVLTDLGWPGHRLVGPDGARAAYLIALHADDDRYLQRIAARMLRRAVDNDDAPADHWAHLQDRALLNSATLQEFGTQYRVGPDGPEPCPVRDPGGLDARRAAVGLPSSAVALAEVRSRLSTPFGQSASDTIVLNPLAGAA